MSSSWSENADRTRPPSPGQTFTVAFIAFVLCFGLVGLWLLGKGVMCDAYDNGLRYCDHYEAPAEVDEPAPTGWLLYVVPGAVVGLALGAARAHRLLP